MPRKKPGRWTFGKPRPQENGHHKTGSRGLRANSKIHAGMKKKRTP